MLTSLPPRALTRLSQLAKNRGAFRLLLGLARVSLVVPTLSMLTGCIVEDPPAFAKPTRTTPRIDLRLATPPLDQIHVVGRGDPIVFRVPVVSEDAGVEVSAYLFLDTTEGPVATDTISASTLDDTSRSLELSYRPSPGSTFGPRKIAEYGCHRFMARVSHLDNFKFDDLYWGIPYNFADVAEVYWWVNVVNIAAGEDDSVLRNCPDRVSSTP